MEPIIPVMNRIITACHNDNQLPWPINVVTDGMFFLHMGDFLVKQVFAKKDISYVGKTFFGLTIGTNPVIRMAAQIILVFRNVMRIGKAHSEVKKACEKMMSAFSERFPTPIRLIKDKTLYLHHAENPYAEVLKCAPQPVAHAAIIVEQIADSIGRVFGSIFACGWSYIELGFSIFIDKIGEFEATSEVASNISEIYNSLVEDPEQISREIEANEQTIDSILPHIIPGMTAKNLSNSVSEAVLLALQVEKVSPIIKSLQETLEQTSFVALELTTNLSVAPLGATNRQGNLYNGSLHSAYSTCKAPTVKLSGRFCPTD